MGLDVQAVRGRRGRAIVTLLVTALAVLASAAPALGQIVPIGVVQGAVEDTDNGFTHRSPFAPPSGNATGATVAIQGVIYSKRLGGTSASPQHGIFLQNTPQTRDGDPRTSDGIFVFMGRFSTLLREGGGTYAPQVGDEVVLTGRVSEFFNMTQLSSVRLQRVVRTGVNVELEVETFVTNPPDDLADAGRYWERRESMRARVPAATLVVSGRDVFGSDAEVWVIRGDHPVALRVDPYARRVFRDPHPLDNVPAELFDDGNGYRILLASNGIKATTGDADVHIAPARTYDTVTNSTTGAVDFTFGKYAVQVEQQIVLDPGVDPASNAPPQAPNRAEEYSAASFNVENLYDYRDDPFDGCDFVGNAGCPGVNPPFNYVPESDEDYRQHVAELAAQIVNDMHSPDVILVQEAEDQDICVVAAGALACGATNNADGRPDTLQELALAVQARGGPAYEAVADRDGADDRGIISAFMFRTDRVDLLPADPNHPVLGSNPQVSYRSAGLPYNTDVQNPKVLNAVLPADVDRSTGTDGSNVFTRAPQVGLFRISPGPSDVRKPVTIYAISNHFSSGPDRRVGQRREQARYNAAITAALEAAEPGARVLVGGDLNVFPRPDDPFAPGHPLFPSDQLAPLYEQGLYNLYDSLVAEAPVSAYSYIFQGQSQTLDQHFVNRALRNDFHRMRVAHVNADWPAEHAGDGPRGASDHDPSVARFFFPEFLAGLGLAKVASTDAVPEGAVVTYTITARNDGPDAATNVVVTDRLPAELTFLGVQASQGTCTGTTEITCSLGTLESAATARVWIDARATGAGTATNTAETRAEQRDPDVSNNTATATVRVEAAVEPPPPPPPDTRCRIDVGPKALVAGRKARVRVSIRMLTTREPAGNAVVRLRGAGVSKKARTNAGGTVRVTVRPKRAGAIRVTAPELTRCSARIAVRRAPPPPPQLTGRR